MKGNTWVPCGPSMRVFLLFPVLTALAGLVGCGGGGSPFGTGPGLGNGANNSMLHGQYAFAFSGSNVASGSFLTVAGSFTADGNGNITNGSEDVNNGTHTQTISFTGKYSVGTDGRATAAISPQVVCPNWQFTMLNSAHALIICINTNTTASGSIDQQDPTAFSDAKLHGNYVFGFSGLGINGGSVSVAGDLAMDGRGGITSGEMDVNDSLAVHTNTSLSGTYTLAPTGRGTATISSSGYVTQHFAFYVVNASDLKFVETDPLTGRSSVMAGEVLTQASGPFSASTLKGGYAFIFGGSDGANLPLSVGGVVTADGKGGLNSGVYDFNDDGSVSLNNAITASPYSFLPSGRGIVSFGPFQLALYPAQNGNIELVEIDGNGVTSGVAEAQSGPAFGLNSISGSYGVNFTGTFLGVNFSTLQEEDITGQLTADGSGNLGGTLDVNNAGSLAAAVPLSASTYTVAPNGRGTSSIHSPTGNFNMQTYQINANTVLLLDTDNVRVLTGLMQKQQ